MSPIPKEIGDRYRAAAKLLEAGKSDPSTSNTYLNQAAVLLAQNIFKPQVLSNPKRFTRLNDLMALEPHLRSVTLFARVLKYSGSPNSSIQEATFLSYAAKRGEPYASWALARKVKDPYMKIKLYNKALRDGIGEPSRSEVIKEYEEIYHKYLEDKRARQTRPVTPEKK